MSPQNIARGWFFWVATVLSLLVLAALAGSLAIGLYAGGSENTRPPLFLYTLVGLTFWLLGTLMGLTKPDQSMIRVGVAATMGIALQLAARALDPVLSLLSPAEFAFSRLLFLTSPLHFAFGFEFFYRFPAGPIPGRWWRVGRASLWSFAIVVWLIRLPRLWGWAFGGPSLNDTWVWPLEEAALGCFAAGIVAAVIVNYRRLEGPDQRRRLQWILAGVFAAAAPNVLLALVNAMGAGFSLNHPVTLIMEFSAILAPLTMVYAILRHRTLGFQVILRQSLQYLLAKGVLWACIAIPLVFLIADIGLHTDQTIGQLLSRNLAAPLCAAVAAVGLWRRESLSHWIDRRFFREAHHRDRVLVDLIEELHELESLEDAPRLLVSSLDRAFHPRTVRMFAADRSTGELTLAESSGEPSPAPARMAANFATTGMLSRESVISVEMLSAEDAILMKDQQAVLAVRLAGAGGATTGLLLLGEKRTEEPYTAKEKALLKTFASQVGVFYENEWLKGRLDREEQVQRTVLAHLGAAEINLVKECPVCGLCYDATEQTCQKDNAELTIAVPVQRTLAGRYLLNRRLGWGGMGTVYLAFDDSLRREVAVKVMMANLFGNRAALRRFEREAHATARLNHPNIVGVYDFGAIGSDGAYLVMELVRGRTWRAALQQAGTFPPALAADRMDQVIEGVKTAHAAGLVHRDLKPENIMIGGSGQIKILDFGLAKLAKGLHESSALTQAGALLGTAGYMAFEQLMGEPADERSDIFALGVIAAEAIVGRRPFEGRNIAELAAAIAKQEWRLPTEPALREVLERCLAREPRERYSGAAELQKELIPALRACAGGDRTPSLSDDSTPTLPMSG